MSIFPFMDPPIVLAPVDSGLPMAREWAWDIQERRFKTRGGKMYIVAGGEAVKIWIWKALQTARYRYLIYTWDWGHEFEPLIGKSYSGAMLQAEAERLTREALSPLGDYVTDIRDLEVRVEKDILEISFVAVTPYGEVEMSV